jgi:hypothetical protein
VTKHSRSGSFLLLTGNEAPQDALLSTESIEVRPLVPKGFLASPSFRDFLHMNMPNYLEIREGIEYNYCVSLCTEGGQLLCKIQRS